jgi:tetratricopeptide (TPR) repeat protein
MPDRAVTAVPDAAVTIKAAMCEGIAALASDDRIRALQCFDAVLALDPLHMGALVIGGGALAVVGEYDKAADFLDRALTIDPNQADALACRGILAGNLGRHEDAIAYFDRILASAPDHGVALNNRAAALMKCERYQEALDTYEGLLASDPSNVDALIAAAAALGKLERYAEAIVRLDSALALAPPRFDALLCRALALGHLERHAEALACLDRALALVPDDIEALVNRGVALGKLYRYEEALACFERVPTINPNCADALDGRGVALARLRRHGEALACLDRALALDAGRVLTRYNRGLIRLAMGDLRGGFADFEGRWRSPDLLGRVQLKTAAPLWLGDAPLSGKTILLHHEQGLGDTIQFARFVPLVAQRGARVVLRVPRVLLELLRTLPAAFELVSESDTLPPHDFHCPLMSLPLALGTALDTIPAEIPYVRADTARIASWRTGLGHRTSARIGIAWAGRQYPPINEERDMPLAMLKPLLNMDADFISLQKDIPRRDRITLDTLPTLMRLGESTTDFADTAALVANLDLVITVDTAVAHLAAALGKPVWILNRYAACWRWFLDRTDSPWYPSARLFRQKSFGDWAGVVAEVKQALAAFIATVHSSG